MTDLRKIIALKKLSPILQQLVANAHPPVQLIDPQGQYLLGHPSSSSPQNPSSYPIRWQQKTLGWVVGANNAESLADLISYLVNQVVKQQRLAQEALERTRELNVIYDITAKVNASLEVKEIGHLVLNEAHQLLRGTNGSIMLLNQQTGYLEIIAAFGKEYTPKTPMFLGEGIAGSVVISGEAEIVNDVFSDMRLIIGHNMVSSLMCAPLKVKDRVIGVMNISSAEPIIYTDSDLKILRALAAQAAPAISNAILHKAILHENKLISEKRYRTVVEQALEGIFLVDADTKKVLEANTSFKNMLGYSSQEIIDLTLYQIVELDPALLDQCLIGLQPQGYNFLGEQQYRCRNGVYLDVEVNVNLISHGRRKAFCIVAHDITQQKLSAAKLKHTEFYDPLTELPNRFLLVDRLKHALARSRSDQSCLAVLFLDLDGFKVINDSLGHSVGDELLKAISQRLVLCLHPQDTIARFGGDEFVILLENIRDLNEATHIADRLLESVQAPLALGEQSLFPTASVGIALSTGKDEPENLLRGADIAMYRAKAQGKARYAVFDINMHAQAMQRMQLETDLRLALERQELCLHYQPVVLLNGTQRPIVGFEALIRWQHPVRGMIHPSQFIPTAEETGLIVAIDQWALIQANKQLKHWQQQFQFPIPLVISINLSGKQFSQPDLIHRITMALAESEMDGQYIKLELTESLIVENDESVIQLLWQLRDLGIQLSIDDFGTGYSSLSRLHLFPINTLKIDRSFLDRMGPNGENSAMIQTIVTLAHSLEMDVVVEGIETEAQVAKMQQLHCEYGQGYFFSPPVDAEAASALLFEQAKAGTNSLTWLA